MTSHLAGFLGSITPRQIIPDPSQPDNTGGSFISVTIPSSRAQFDVDPSLILSAGPFHEHLFRELEGLFRFWDRDCRQCAAELLAEIAVTLNRGISH